MAPFIVSFLIFASIHSLLAIPGIKERIADLLGSWGRWYRLGYNIISVALFAWVMSAWPHPPVIYFIPGIWGLLCYLIQIGAALLLCRCAAQLDLPAFLGLRPSDSATTLFQGGCYGCVRHPQYSLAIVFFVANPVMTGRWLALTLLSSLYFVIGAWLEEQRLLKEFGDEYRRYRANVPMFIPSLQRGMNENRGKVN